MGIFVNLHNRGQAACADASNRFQRKAQVVSCMPCFNVKFFFQRLQNSFAAAYVAGSALAYADNIAPARIKMELRIKSYNAVNLRNGGAGTYSSASVGR